MSTEKSDRLYIMSV